VANNLGILTEEQGRLRVAERFYHKAFTVFDRTGVRRHRAYSLGNLANLHRHGARYERAREAYEEVETELRAMGEAHAAAYTVGNIGDLERDFGDWTAARQRYETTLEFARKSGDEELKSECYSRIARLHLMAGRLELMPRMLAHAAKAASLAESREFTLYAQLLTAELDLAKGRIPSAARRLKTVQAGAMHVGLVYYQLWTEHALSRINAAEGDVGRASSRCLAGMSKARSSGYRWWELRFAALGASESMGSASRARCRRRFEALVREIETGIGDSAVRARFFNLPLVREGVTFEASPESIATRVQS
jgi:tetratricopeptide (TPR) repeat protein